MNHDELYTVVSDFRNAIVNAKKDFKFGKRDVMNRFPNGCCEFASDLLAYYLKNRYSILTKRYNGVYDDGSFANKTNHEWLEYHGTVIDITYSQFEFATGDSKEIFFGTRSAFYDSLYAITELNYYNIEDLDWLLKDYEIIISYVDK